jgi:hypothetical protein
MLSRGSSFSLPALAFDKSSEVSAGQQLRDALSQQVPCLMPAPSGLKLGALSRATSARPLCAGGGRHRPLPRVGRERYRHRDEEGVPRGHAPARPQGLPDQGAPRLR